MDRTFVYPGALPQDTDLMSPQRAIMVAIGALIQSTLGTGPVADGLACTPTTTPSMSVTIAQGWMAAQSSVDASAFGSLAADTSTIMKMGVNTAATTLGPMTAPATAGQSVVYLVQAAMQETDALPVALYYYNASNPAVPFIGPAGSGTAQNTVRTQRVALQLKQGVAATTGSQATPSADTGFTALYTITIANGATSIVAGNIATIASAPFVAFKLPQLRPGFSAETAFTSSGSFTVPAGVSKLKVRAVGGGGGGASSNVSASGGGGGAGGFVEGVFTVTAGTVYTVTIGAGGAGGVASNGSAGGTTSVVGLVSATGGSGGANDGGGQSGGAGGVGSGGTVNLSGGYGSPGCTTLVVGTGAGGASAFGGGGQAGTTAGYAGQAPGSGGGGGYNTNGISGGAGKAGIVVIEY